MFYDEMIKISWPLLLAQLQGQLEKYLSRSSHLGIFNNLGSSHVIDFKARDLLKVFFGAVACLWRLFSKMAEYVSAV